MQINSQKTPLEVAESLVNLQNVTVNVASLPSLQNGIMSPATLISPTSLPKSSESVSKQPISSTFSSPLSRVSLSSVSPSTILVTSVSTGTPAIPHTASTTVTLSTPSRSTIVISHQKGDPVSIANLPSTTALKVLPQNIKIVSNAKSLAGVNSKLISQISNSAFFANTKNLKVSPKIIVQPTLVKKDESFAPKVSQPTLIRNENSTHATPTPKTVYNNNSMNKANAVAQGSNSSVLLTPASTPQQTCVTPGAYVSPHLASTPGTPAHISSKSHLSTSKVHASSNSRSPDMPVYNASPLTSRNVSVVVSQNQSQGKRAHMPETNHIASTSQSSKLMKSWSEVENDLAKLVPRSQHGDSTPSKKNKGESWEAGWQPSGVITNTPPNKHHTHSHNANGPSPQSIERNEINFRSESGRGVIDSKRPTDGQQRSPLQIVKPTGNAFATPPSPRAQVPAEKCYSHQSPSSKISPGLPSPRSSPIVIPRPSLVISGKMTSPLSHMDNRHSPLERPVDKRPSAIDRRHSIEERNNLNHATATPSQQHNHFPTASQFDQRLQRMHQGQK